MKKHILSVDLGGSGTKLALMDLKGKVITKGRFETKASEGPASFFNRLKVKIGIMLARVTGGKDSLKAIGMGSPGPLDGKRGIMYHSANFPGWKNVDFNKFFTSEYGVPAFFDNDVNLVALGEYEQKLRAAFDYIIVLTLGTGLGGAYIERGKLLHGRDGFAGEFGHIEIKNNGVLCGCGSRGCLEAYVSASGIYKRLKAMERSPVKKKDFLDLLSERTPKGVYDLAEKHNSHALAFFRETGHYLGMGLKTVTNIFNPEAIFIGGGMYDALKYILPEAREYLKQNGFPEMIRGLQLRKIKFSENSALYGGFLIARKGI